MGTRWWQIQLRQIHPHHEARIRRVDLVVAEQQKHWSESRDQTSRMSFSNDARLINKDLGRIIAETTPSSPKKQTLSATNKLNLDHPNRPPPISGSLYTFSNSRDHLRWIIRFKRKIQYWLRVCSLFHPQCDCPFLSLELKKPLSLGRSSKLLCPRKRTGRTDVDHSFGRVRFRGKNRRSSSLENLSVSCEAERYCLFYYCYLGEGRVGILFLFIFL